jgi:hypothetical protein
MNYGHVGCGGRTLDWVHILGTPLCSMRMWKTPQNLLAIYGASKCAAVPAQRCMGEEALFSNFSYFLSNPNICGIRCKIRESLQVSLSESKPPID